MSGVFGFLSKAASKASSIASLALNGKEKPDNSNVPFIDDPCLSCAAPCADGHASYPEALAKTIDQTEDLLSSMKPYKRHLMFCAGQGPDWAEHIENNLPKEAYYLKLEDAVKKGSKDSKAGRTIISAIDKNPDGHSEGTERVESVVATECFLFPEYKALRGVTAAAASTLITDWVSTGVVPSSLPSSAPPGAVIVDLDLDAYVFVCVHKKRDKRCGVAGPLLITEFQNVIDELGISGKVACIGISHIGGHKFAGNVIVYSKTFKNGIWYGRVIPCHVENIVKKTILDGKVFKELFRGQGTI